jgi:hypothetical protein
MLSSLVGSFGFRTTFKVTFERMITTPLGSTTLPLPTIVPVSRSFFEAEVKVRMTSTGSANTFELTIYGLGNDIYKLLEPQKTILHITLGYADGATSEVMTGLLTEKHLRAGDCWYEATLSGVDYIFDQLQHPASLARQNYEVRSTYQNKTLGDIARALCSLAGVSPNITVTGPAQASMVFDNVTPLQALRKVAEKGGFSIQAKDGKLWMGNPSDLGVTQLQPIKDGATEQPLTARGATPDAGTLDGQDFRVAGVPSLRPSDLVTLGKSQYRIESVNHELKRDGGYLCWGRAVSPSASHADMQAAARPSAAQVARQVQQNVASHERRRPAVSAGDINDYVPGQHTATVNTGQKATPDMVSPSVQAPLRSDPVPLPNKPIASPFAFGSCGLVVPVYPRMRALLVHGWHEPDDAIVDGFLWTTQMTPPPNQQGDWWLCLPTELDADGLPTGNTVDDLITKDGQRIIQVRGMQITIGAGLLNTAGSRPTPGSDESLTIQTDQGARIMIKGQQIQLTDGGVTMTISNGQISIS